MKLEPVSEDPNGTARFEAHPMGLPIFSTLKHNNDFSPSPNVSSSSSQSLLSNLTSPLFFPRPLPAELYKENTFLFIAHGTEAIVSTVYVNHTRTRTNNPDEAFWDELLIMDTGCLGMSVTRDGRMCLRGSVHAVTDVKIEGYRESDSRDAQGIGNLPFIGKVILDSHAKISLICTRIMHKDNESFVIEDSDTDSYSIWKENSDRTCKLLFCAPYQEGVGYVIITFRDLIHAFNSAINASSSERCELVATLTANYCRT
jgi:hypothetical protein